MYTRKHSAVVTSTSTGCVDLEAYLLSVVHQILHQISLLNLSQERDQGEIELKEDSPHALEGVLRHIYGYDVEFYGLKTWQYWLDLVETADKYLERELSLRASMYFQLQAEAEGSEIGTICEMLQTLRDTDFAVDLAMQHLHLLKDEQFRAQLLSCRQVMFKLVERLSLAADLKPEQLRSAHYGPEEFCRKRKRSLPTKSIRI